jgi:hypothetical protein
VVAFLYGDFTYFARLHIVGKETQFEVAAASDCDRYPNEGIAFPVGGMKRDHGTDGATCDKKDERRGESGSANRGKPQPDAATSPLKAD